MGSLIVAFVLAIIGLAAFDAWKKNNPEKWAKFQREVEDSEAKSFAKKYEKAMRRVPDSQWILMTREEKSRVYQAREALVPAYQSLSIRGRELVLKKYGIKPDFKRLRR